MKPLADDLRDALCESENRRQARLAALINELIDEEEQNAAAVRRVQAENETPWHPR